VGKRSRKIGGQAAAPVQSGGQAGRLSSIGIVVILIAVWVVYGRSLHFPFTNFDDFDYVVDNRHVADGFTLANIRWALTAMYSSNWHPLTWISHQIDVSLFGIDAGKLRIGSIVLHCASTILLYLFLVQTTARRWASLIVAALFALHPLRVESIVWVSERKDTLSTFLFLATLLAYVQYTRTRSIARYLLTFLLFVLGLAAKPMLITLPFVLILIDYWPLNRGLHLLEKLPMFALIPPSAIITMRAQKASIQPIAISIRFANAVESYAKYIAKIVWPDSLAILYPYPKTVPVLGCIIGAIVLVALTFIALRYAKRRPYLLVGWLWFVGTLVPVIGVVQVGAQSMADRYTYIPSIGFTIAIVWLIADLLRNRARSEAAIATTIVIVILAVLTFTQVGYWRDTITLFDHAVAVAPKNPQALNALGREYLHLDDYNRAVDYFHQAIAVDPDAHEAHDALGSALNEMGDAEGGEREVRAALRIFPTAIYYRDLGEILLSQGRTDEALRIYEQALAKERDPETLAEIAAIRGDVNGATQHFREAIEERPHAPDLHNNLAAMLARAGHDDEAIREYQTAVRIAPKQYDAHMNLGAILTRHQRASEAMAEFQAAAQIRPSSPEPHVYTALLYAQMKQIDNAITELRAAAQIDEAATNDELTNALGLDPKPTNLRDYVAFLESKR